MLTRTIAIGLRTLFTCLLMTLIARGATLADLSSRATAIVIGTVTTRTEAPDGVSFDIDVERALMGNASAGLLHIQHAWGQRSVGPTGTIDANFHGVWFLTQDSAGRWDALVTRNGISVERLFLPTLGSPLPAAFSYPNNAPLLDVLVFEVGAGLQANGQNPEVLLDSLGQMDGAAVQTVLSAYLTSPVPSLEATALAALLYRGRQGALATLLQKWPAIANEPRRAFVLSALRNFWRDATPEAVQQLVSIVNQAPPGSELREPAIRALAAMHSKEALPTLALLLQSSNTSEQMQGVFGLASFANGCPMQSNDNVVSMAYLTCGQASLLRTEDTLANFLLPVSGAAGISSAVSFWQQWWNQRVELH